MGQFCSTILNRDGKFQIAHFSFLNVLHATPTGPCTEEAHPKQGLVSRYPVGPPVGVGGIQNIQIIRSERHNIRTLIRTFKSLR